MSGLNLKIEKNTIDLVFNEDVIITVRLDRLIHESSLAKTMLEDEKYVPDEIRFPYSCSGRVASKIEKYLNMDEPKVKYNELKTEMAKEYHFDDYSECFYKLFMYDIYDIPKMYGVIRYLGLYDSSIYKKKYTERHWSEHSGHLLEILFINSTRIFNDKLSTEYMSKCDELACLEYQFKNHKYGRLDPFNWTWNDLATSDDEVVKYEYYKKNPLLLRNIVVKTQSGPWKFKNAHNVHVIIPDKKSLSRNDFKKYLEKYFKDFADNCFYLNNVYVDNEKIHAPEDVIMPIIEKTNSLELHDQVSHRILNVKKSESGWYDIETNDYEIFVYPELKYKKIRTMTLHCCANCYYDGVMWDTYIEKLILVPLGPYACDICEHRGSINYVPGQCDHIELRSNNSNDEMFIITEAFQDELKKDGVKISGKYGVVKLVGF